MKIKKLFCLTLLLFLSFEKLMATEVVLIELEKKTEQALGFYPWDQERQVKLLGIILERGPKALLSLLPKLEIDESVKSLLALHPSLFLRGSTKPKLKQVGEFKHLADEVLLYDTSTNFESILFSLIDYLKLAKSEKNVSWTYKANLSLSSYKKISALDFFTLEELPDLKDKVVILTYHGRNMVKEKGSSSLYTYPGNVAAAIVAELSKGAPQKGK